MFHLACESVTLPWYFVGNETVPLGPNDISGNALPQMRGCMLADHFILSQEGAYQACLNWQYFKYSKQLQPAIQPLVPQSHLPSLITVMYEKVTWMIY